jgi:mono/diheme cytochrome c family protein
VSGLRGWEFQFLQSLLADPDWQKQEPGRGAMLQMLTSAVMTERDPGKVEPLIALVANQTPAQGWRQKSLLAGMVASVQSQTAQPFPILLSSAPKALETLARSDDPTLGQQIERLERFLAWPGHQPVAADGTAEPAPPAVLADPATLAMGKSLFEQICAGCHGLTGEGLTPLAPPLHKASWVLGPESRLVRISLDGVSGRIHVNATQYEPPQILPEMPSLRAALDNDQIASVLTYVRQAFGSGASPISPAQVGQIRQETERRETPWTEEELLGIK